MLCKVKVSLVKSFISHSIDIMIVNAFIVFQELKKENSQMLDNLLVHFGQLEFRESLIKKTLFHYGNCSVNLCFSPDRDCFTKWHSAECARVRAWVDKMVGIKIIKLC